MIYLIISLRDTLDTCDLSHHLIERYSLILVIYLIISLRDTIAILPQHIDPAPTSDPSSSLDSIMPPRRVLNSNNVLTLVMALVLSGILLSILIDGEAIAANRSSPVHNVLRHNPLNKYMVKFGWFWTIVPLVLWYLVHSSRGASSSWWVRRGLSLVVATVLWKLNVLAFDYIHDELHSALDISGHCFLLIFSSLIYADETPELDLLSNPTAALSSFSARAVVATVIGFVRLVWLLMLFITAVFFHDPVSKLLGSGLAYVSWLVWRNAKAAIERHH